MVEITRTSIEDYERTVCQPNPTCSHSIQRPHRASKAEPGGRDRSRAGKVMGPVDRLLFAGFERLLADAGHGVIRVTLPSGAARQFGSLSEGAAGTESGPRADLVLCRYRALWQFLRRGTNGFAESYMSSDIDTADLDGLLTYFNANFSAIEKRFGRNFPSARGDRDFHRARANTLEGSRRNIAAHYDLGNAFYSQWLDETMTYSSAIFSGANDTLARAQHNKYREILSWLDLGPSSHVLEIGCGWGGFAEAAARAGHTSTGLTISSEQLAWARERLERAGLADNASFRFEDYRLVEGTYDGVVSIEMIEAVGEENWPVYFKVLHDRLKAGGSAVIQAITIDEEYFPIYRARPDFIQRYIFPGGMLLTKSAIAEQAEAAGLSLERTMFFPDSYARTLRIWRSRFEKAWTELEKMGFDERFRRMWIYYLTYCAVGFDHRSIDVGLYLLRRR